MLGQAMIITYGPVSPARAQGAPEMRSQQHFLHDFDLSAIGLVLVVVLAVLGLRKFTGR